MSLSGIKALVHARLGLRFEGADERRLRHALARRRAATGAGSAAAYLLRLHSDHSEFASLASLLTINETYFHREPHHLHLLTGRLLPRLLARAGARLPLGILSLGCSSGEEPYSLAMVLRERWGAAAAGLFRITGGDVDEAALAAARRAVYPESALRALPAAAAARWFSSAGGGERRLHEALRAAVRFEPLNVLDPEFAAALPAQDVILYRNLSIYFDTATRRMALNNLQRALAPGGVLLVGTTEVMANDLGLFALHVEDGVWYFRAGPPAGSNGSAAPGAAAAAGAPPRPAADTSVPAAGDEAGAARARYTRALQQAHAGDLAEALAALRDGPAAGDDPASAPELAPEAAALEARLLLELGDLANAKSAAERLVGTDAWSASGLGLLARIAQLEDDPEAAIGHAERAVYARPEYWPALLLLAELYRARGRSAHAARTYRRLLRQLDDETKAAANGGPLPPLLPIADLRSLCRARLARLSEAPP